MKKIYICIMSLMVVLCCFSGCDSDNFVRYTEEDIVSNQAYSGYPVKYRKEEIIGMTSAEVVEKYGEFDRKDPSAFSDGQYRNTTCGYMTVPARPAGFFYESQPPVYFTISFDENGIAVYCRYEQPV